MPRPRNRTFLVNPLEILFFPQIRDEKWTLLTIMPEIATPEHAIKWLAKRRLLRNTALCDICKNPASFTHYANGIDKFRWKCTGCSWTKTIRYNSFFAMSHVSLQKLIQLTYFWALDMPLHAIERELQLTRSTIINWCNFSRDLCCEWVNNNFQQIGGPDGAVEIDESNFFRRKTPEHSGQQQWVFGGVERGTRKCFLVPVSDVSADTLEPIIQKYIAPGTTILTHDHAAYRNLTDLGGGIYKHKVINSYDDGNNQTYQSFESIESLWELCKKKLRNQSGTNQESFPSYMKEIMWKENVPRSQNKDIFSCFCELIGHTYHVIELQIYS